jgi:ATP-binding cassette, subfamily B, bacterial MsbA
MGATTSERRSTETYLRLLGYLGPYRGLLLAAFGATAAFATFDAFSFVMIIPFLEALFGVQGTTGAVAGNALEGFIGATLGRVVDLDQPSAELLNSLIIFLFLVFLIKNVFDFLQQYLVVRLEQAITRDLRNQVYRHMLDLDLRFFGRTKAGQIIARITGDVELLRNLVTKNVAKFVTSLLQVAAFAIVMLSISVRLTFVGLIVLPLMFGVWRRMIRRLKRGDHRILHLYGEISSQLQETVTGIRQVKAAAAEDWERQRFARNTHDYFKAVTRNERIRALASPGTEMMGAVATLLLLWYGTRLVLSPTPELDGAHFMGFLLASMKLYAPAKWLARFPATVQPGLVAAERVFEFLDTPIELKDQTGARPFTGVREAVRFEDVSFEYEADAPVLRDVSVEVKAGEVVALVGPSGAGKTTLVDLIARFYDPSAGRITIDGVDLREFSLQSLRSNLGVVAQESILFHETVRANIAYGRPDTSSEAIEAAARAANAHEFIVRLPEGYDTILGERATRLSGGQRQRIAIARAILRDPPILILDEATSALDSESEQLVQAAIQRLLEGRTVFVIAHRLSTIRNADQILVMQDGRIVQRGRHDDLLADDGLYRHLYRLQFAPEDEAALRAMAERA